MSKYDKYKTAHAEKVKYLEEKLQQEKSRKTKKPQTANIMGAPILKIKENDTEYSLRFLPPLDPNNWFSAKLVSHWVTHPTMKKPNGDDVKVKITCAQENYGKNCYLCNEWEKIKKMFTGNREDWWTWFQGERQKPENQMYQARKEYYSPVIYNDEIMVFQYGAQIHNQLEDCLKDRYGGWFNHPVEGFPIHVQREKTGNSPWNVAYKIKYLNTESTPLAETEEEIDEILEQTPDVWEFVTEDYQWGEIGCLYTNPQLRAILQGADKDLFREVNQQAMDEHGFVPDDNGIELWKGNTEEANIAEELTLASENDKYETMTKKELADECRKRGIRTSLKWKHSDYLSALTDDIPF
tara:strand:- start:289 stop:1347 length:1059 start_codon:yes stop_codon:yes gene_type:complete